MARWKARSAPPVGCAEPQQPLELEERLLDRRFLRRAAALRGERGALDLDGEADLEHVERRSTPGCPSRTASAPKVEARWRDGEHAGALPRLDQPVGGERGDRLAHHRAADAELRGQLRLGRQLAGRAGMTPPMRSARAASRRRVAESFGARRQRIAVRVGHRQPPLNRRGSQSEISGM